MPMQTRSSKKAETPSASKPNPIGKHVKAKPGKDVKQILGDVSERYNKSDVQGRQNIDDQYLFNGVAPNGEAPNGEPPYGEPPNGEPPYGEPPNGEPPNGEPPNAEQPNGEPPSGQPPNGQPPNAEPPNAEPPNSEAPNVKKTLEELYASLASHKDPDVKKELYDYLALHKVPDLKMEDLDESLFVPQAQDMEDPEDVFNISGPHPHSHDKSAENEEEMGYFVGPFGRVYQIVRQGRIRNCKFVARWAPLTAEDLTEDLETEPTKYKKCSKRNLTKNEKNLKIQSLQGVAWAYNEYEKSYLQSIAPKTWTKEQSKEIGTISERRRPPALKIRVKWQDGKTSWETRTTVKNHWPRSGPNGPRYKVTIEEPVKYKDLIILDVGDTIENADLAMVKTAIRCQKNYANFLEEMEERENTPQIEPDSAN